MTDLVQLSLSDSPKATRLVNNRAGWNLVSLVIQEFLLRSPIQLTEMPWPVAKSVALPQSGKKRKGVEGEAELK